MALKGSLNTQFVMSQLAQKGPPCDIEEGMEDGDGNVVVSQILVASLTFKLFNLSTLIYISWVFQMACNSLTTSHLVVKCGAKKACMQRMCIV